MGNELHILHTLGLIIYDGGTIIRTHRGQYDWIVLMREFYIGVDNFRDEMRRYVGAELAVLSE